MSLARTQRDWHPHILLWETVQEVVQWLNVNVTSHMTTPNTHSRIKNLCCSGNKTNVYQQVNG